MRAPSWLPDPARRVLRPVRQLWRTGVRRARRSTIVVRRSWRRSLQVRVVTITLALSSLLVGAFGLFVATRSADILLTRATEDVHARLASKVQYAVSQLTVHRQPFDARLPNSMSATVRSLSEGDPGQSG